MKSFFILHRIFVFLLCFNIIISFITFEDQKKKSSGKPLKKITTFEEFDEVMSNSEFNKAWERFKKARKDPKYKYEVYNNIEDIKKEKIQKEKVTNEDTDSCLVSESEAKRMLQEQGMSDVTIDKRTRYILGNCNPVILVPGMLSTKLQIRINCTGLKQDDQDIYKKMQFYCGPYLCYGDTNYVEENLFISALGPFEVVALTDENKYSACLGYFLSFFNSEKACASYNNNEYVCNYSPHVQIGYYGITHRTNDEGKCGLEAIRDVIMIDLPGIDVDLGVAKSMGVLIDRLENKGYEAGFSLAGIPNDYRQFLAKNDFTMSSFRYLIERLYNNTGKPVVLIGHSFGTITLYNSIIKKSHKDLIPKIKKFIAVGPPFAGSTELIEVFFKGGNKYTREFDIEGMTLEAGFDEFGFGFIINKLPTAIELRPLPIIGSLFTKPGYEIFAEAIKERFFLEKKCGHNYCDDYLIKRYSKKFNALFKGYFPLLTDAECKFENNRKDTKKMFERKCLMDMLDMFDCPIIIEETRDKSGKLPSDVEAYCGSISDNVYYQTSCKNSEDKQCLDNVYSKHVKYPFETSNEKAKWFIDNWNMDEENRKKYGEMTFDQVYDSKEKYTKTVDKQVEYYDQISLTKDMPTPTVDTDIVYSTYNPTVAGFIFDKSDFSTDYVHLNKGGDGVVPNWSPIIPGLKWIYDTKKYNLKTKIRLVEFCSRLAKDSQYAYDPNKEQTFAAIGCSCINSKNEFNSTGCSHGVMIADEAFLKYVGSIVSGTSYKIEQKKDALKKYNSNENYNAKCTNDLLYLLFPNYIDPWDIPIDIPTDEE